MTAVYLPKVLQPFRCNSLIRLGKDHDGGYLVNSLDLTQTRYLVSFGIGEDFSFERDFLETTKCQCYSYDQTVESRDLAEYNITHFQKNIGNQPHQQSIESALDGLDDVFLKCDIESNEYEILNDIIKHCHMFTGMIVEFHDVTQQNNFHFMANFIAKVQQKLVHTHINNYMYYKTPDGILPDVLELTFTSSANIQFDPDLALPNQLDMPNNPNDDVFSVLFK